MTTCNILHLSDLHLSSQEHGEALAASLLLDIGTTWVRDNRTVLRGHEPRLFTQDELNLIVVTGDLTNTARNEEFEAAYSFLDRLTNKLLDGDRQRMVLVPGNHDVDWSVTRSNGVFQRIDWDTYSRLGGETTSDLRKLLDWKTGQMTYYRLIDRARYKTRLDGYSSLVHRFYGNAVAFDVAREDSHFHVFDALAHSHRIVVAGLSSVAENDHMRRRGTIDQGARRKVVAALAEKFNADHFCWIGAFHHGLLPRVGAEDSLDINDLNDLLRSGFRLFLHGHVHTVGHGELADLRFAVPTSWTGRATPPSSSHPSDGSLRYTALCLDPPLGRGIAHVRQSTATNGRHDIQWEPDCTYGSQKRPYYYLRIPIWSADSRGLEDHAAMVLAYQIQKLGEGGPEGEATLEALRRALDKSNNNLAPNDYFHGRRIIAELGSGAMTTVYKVYNPARNRHEALKMLRRDHWTNPSTVSAFRRGIAALRALRGHASPDVVSLFDVFLETKEYAYTMTYVDGKTLRSLISSEAGSIDLSTRLDIIEKIAKALTSVHRRGVFHHDLCPENVLVTSPRHDVVLVDFDFARLRASTVAESGLQGHLAFLAPETLRESWRGRYGAAQDVYSLGMVIAFALTSQSPRLEWSQDTLYALLRERGIGDGLIQLVMNCADKDVSRRYQDVDAVIRDLRFVRRRPENVPAPTSSFWVEREGKMLTSEEIARYTQVSLFVASVAVLISLAFLVLHLRPAGLAATLCFLAPTFTQVHFGSKDIALIRDARGPVNKRDHAWAFVGIFLLVTPLFVSALYFHVTGSPTFLLLSWYAMILVNVVITMIWLRRVRDAKEYPRSAKDDLATRKVQNYYRHWHRRRQALLAVLNGGILCWYFAGGLSFDLVLWVLLAIWAPMEWWIYTWRRAAMEVK